MAALSIKTIQLNMLVSVLALVSGYTHLPPARTCSRNGRRLSVHLP